MGAAALLLYVSKMPRPFARSHVYNWVTVNVVTVVMHTRTSLRRLAQPQTRKASYFSVTA